MAAAMLPGCAATDRVGDARESVIGGESSDPGAYPATGALLHGLAYRCTATLIAPDVAITAAHCLAEGGFGDFGFTLDADLGDGMGHPIEVLAHHQHPEFRETAEELTRMGQRNDVGVVILAEPIEGVAVEELDLGLDPGGADGDLESGSALTLCGYGRDQWATSETAGVKREGVLHVDRVGDWELETTHDGPQACRGDSGAPLFAETSDGRVIAGLVSRAVGDSHMCDSGGIHTRVAPYAEWIAQASRDRDVGGCQAGGGGTGGAGAAFALLAACALAVRGRRRHARSSPRQPREPRQPRQPRQPRRPRWPTSAVRTSRMSQGHVRGRPSYRRVSPGPRRSRAAPSGGGAE
ncbi:MAG TPA: trypsin-like serine protease [Kofleriaceae bacterium]|nr:trypsin-like serine protease [Kofleriaceae bacterium]